jgi:ubiquinone/menaquinone biosynthesis C-methylase UbiE
MADHTHTCFEANKAHFDNHTHPHTYFEANKAHFDDAEAEKYDKRPDAIELTRRQCNAMLKVYPFNESETTVMDFACGTGKSP